MYNGIGLQTARGSGTNGYVQRNLSSLRPRENAHKSSLPMHRSEETKVRHVQPDEKILEHERKRKVEIQCLELQDELEEQGVADAEVARRVAELRASLLAQLRGEPAAMPHAEARSLRVSDTHALAAAKQQETHQMQRALRIDPEYKEGDAFDQELQERRKYERREERAWHAEQAERGRASRRDGPDMPRSGWASAREAPRDSRNSRERSPPPPGAPPCPPFAVRAASPPISPPSRTPSPPRV
ncbi:RNA-splicing factor [Malassezia sp. CBS 17886]|nr:RNA-splicing factor [Malassezia sp. CBS 17886]